MISLVFSTTGNIYAQEGNKEELADQYPLAFNEDGQVKEYIDCKPAGGSSTDLYGNERYANTGTVDNRIAELQDSISTLEDLNSDGDLDNIVENTQSELDCLEDVRAVKVASGNMFN